MARKIGVLVVDDSAFIRRALIRMLKSDPSLIVLGEASDGEEAIHKVLQLKPDVITLDVQMYGMDGLQALARIMRERPTPVLMVSSLTSEGGGITLRALELGAVDFIDKSSCHTMLDILNIAESLVQKVKILAGVDIRKVAPTHPPVPVPPAPTVAPSSGPRVGQAPTHLVLIGSSTGGPVALESVFRSIPRDYSGAILAVQHMPPGFTRSLAERLNGLCPIAVREAEEDDPIISGTVYIAPAGYHLKLRRQEDGLRVLLSRQPSDTQHCPSVDVLFESAAETWGGRTLAIVLTGMGQDGSAGIQKLSARGATILAQDEASCVVFGMPRAAYQTGCVDRFVPLNRIAENILAFR